MRTVRSPTGLTRLTGLTGLTGTVLALVTVLTLSGCQSRPTTSAAALSAVTGEREYRRPGPAVRRTPDGFLVVRSHRRAVGSGPVTRYTVEVEPSLTRHLPGLQTSTGLALGANNRGWAASHRLRQVGEPAHAQVRVLLARPATVDRLCAQAGYVTGGRLSCWNGRFAALNAWRWRHGSPGFRSLAQYRLYLVNHEFGHGLGLGHEACPAVGASAPLMMQQSKGLLGCRANAWPYPASRSNASARSAG